MDNLFADISDNNNGFSAGAYASAGHGVIAIKATEGTTETQPTYGPWVADAHHHKLAVLHYHFARPEDGNPSGQADHFWGVVQHWFHRPGDYVVVDVETDTPQNGAAWTREFDRRLRAISGTDPWLYTFLSYFQVGHPTVQSGNYWIAAWGTQRPGNRRWQLGNGQRLIAWQRTDGQSGPDPHSMAGIPGSCDVSQLSPSLYKAYKNGGRP